MLLEVHGRLANTAAFYTFVIAAWALVLFLRGRSLDGNFLGAVVIGEVLLVSQALVGTALLLGPASSPQRWVHLLYGVLTALVWPFLFTYTRGEEARSEALVFGLGTLFLWGLVLRATTTG
jgi:hypothetical protein